MAVKAALDDDPQMFVDYVRVYQFEGQSIKIAERPESSAGGALSAVTAIAVLSVLGVILSLCLVRIAWEGSCSCLLRRWPSCEGLSWALRRLLVFSVRAQCD